MMDWSAVTKETRQIYGEEISAKQTEECVPISVYEFESLCMPVCMSLFV